ncbi:MAG: response regulator [Planctomycetaceae bacterium]
MTETRKKSLLLVDDEPDVLLSLKGLLRREFELHTAESGDEALRILENHPIDIVMSDQRMPGMTGAELMIQVRNRFPETVRIVFTGYADIKAVIDGVNGAGLYRYIAKPWDPDDLLKTLHEAAGRHALRQQHRQSRQKMLSFAQAVTAYLESTGSTEVTPTHHDLLQQARQLCSELANPDEHAVRADL